MAIGQGMMNTAMEMSDSTHVSASDFSYDAQRGMLPGKSSSAHMMTMGMMSQGDECQSDCDCCPNLCFAYLPTSTRSTTFLPLNFTLADSAIQRKVSTITTLFRPPISH